MYKHIFNILHSNLPLSGPSLNKTLKNKLQKPCFIFQLVNFLVCTGFIQVHLRTKCTCGIACTPFLIPLSILASVMVFVGVVREV